MATARDGTQIPISIVYKQDGKMANTPVAQWLWRVRRKLPSVVLNPTRSLTVVIAAHIRGGGNGAQVV